MSSPKLQMKHVSRNRSKEKKHDSCQKFDDYRIKRDLEELGWNTVLVSTFVLAFRKQGLTSKNFIALGEGQDKKIANKLLQAFKSLEESQANEIMSSVKESDLLAIEKQANKRIGVVVQRKDGSFPKILSTTCSDIWFAKPELNLFSPVEKKIYRYQ